MPPLSFIARPERWLQAIHRYRGTLSASPNFGYELCCSRLDDGQLEGLDLSSWRLAFNGAEPVIPATLRRFEERFGPTASGPPPRPRSTAWPNPRSAWPSRPPAGGRSSSGSTATFFSPPARQ